MQMSAKLPYLVCAARERQRMIHSEVAIWKQFFCFDMQFFVETEIRFLYLCRIVRRVLLVR
jgi:hypothetical protein